MANILLIHHRSDSDGLLSGTIAYQALTSEQDNKVTVVGWDYNDPVPDTSIYDKIWMVDISVAAILDKPELRSKVCIIDHHKTVIDNWGKFELDFRYWHVNVDFAACRLVAAYFNGYKLGPDSIQTRHISEDELVFMVGLLDAWKHEGTPFEEACQHLELGFRTQWPPDFDGYLKLDIDEACRYWRVRYTELGASVSTYVAAQAKEKAERGAMIVELAGLKFLALNSLGRGSMILDAYSRRMKDTMPHDALMVWGVDKDKKVSMSLYHSPHRKDLDLSVIAKGYGGGGHRGACGCRVDFGTMAMILNQPTALV